MTTKEQEQRGHVAELGDRLGALRLCEATALEAMQRSLGRQGQLTPVVVFEQDGRLEVLDGFKRLRAARALGWPTLAITVAHVGRVAAKLWLAELHRQRGLSELEEGWLVRSLHREDRLSQSEIARQLDRHKSWVCRRLMLVETLDTTVQADVRLGLLAPRTAMALGALPRGNQPSAAEVVMRQGWTVRQTELWVAELVALSDPVARAAEIARRRDGGAPTPAKARRRAARSEAERMAADIATVRSVSSRLQARLLGTPLPALGSPAAGLVGEALLELGAVLAALGRTVAAVLDKEVSG